MLGRVVGNYRVEKKLGEGGMGAVYRLCHTRLPNTYAALKVLTHESAGSPWARERFAQEAMVAAAVGSHRVVKPLDVGELEDGIPYILMEYVPGRSLAEVLEDDGPLPVLAALKIAYRVADTMTAAHRAGIIHRDIKPQNIMLEREHETESVRLLDFGVARATGALKVAETCERAIVGTPGYLAPEAAAARTVDGRSDVFSLAVVLYQMLTGVAPFAGDNPQESIVNVLTRPAPPIALHRPPHLEPAPLSVEEIVARALCKEPARRYTMAELQRALWRVMSPILAARDDGTIFNTSLSIRLPREQRPDETPTLSVAADAFRDELRDEPPRIGAADRQAAGGGETAIAIPRASGSKREQMGARSAPASLRRGHVIALLVMGAFAVGAITAGVMWRRVAHERRRAAAEPVAASLPARVPPPPTITQIVPESIPPAALQIAQDVQVEVVRAVVAVTFSTSKRSASARTSSGSSPSSSNRSQPRSPAVSSVAPAPPPPAKTPKAVDLERIEELE